MADNMIIRRYDELNFNNTLIKSECDVSANQKIGIIYVQKRGYMLFNVENETWNDFIFIKTMTKPVEYTKENLDEKIHKNKNDFINLITEILNDIYKDQNIKEYEKKHPEYVFMELFDKLNSAQIEEITPDHKYYKLVEEGFTKIEINQFQNFAKSISLRLQAMYSRQHPNQPQKTNQPPRPNQQPNRNFNQR